MDQYVPRKVNNQFETKIPVTPESTQTKPGDEYYMFENISEKALRNALAAKEGIPSVDLTKSSKNSII